MYRRYHADGTFAGDVVTLESDPRPGEPLLARVIERGKRLASPALDSARAHALAQLERLPAPLRSLEAALAPYPVEIAPALRAAAEAVDRTTGCASFSSAAT